jgi:hypothetical protein
MFYCSYNLFSKLLQYKLDNDSSNLAYVLPWLVRGKTHSSWSDFDLSKSKFWNYLIKLFHSNRTSKITSHFSVLYIISFCTPYKNILVENILKYVCYSEIGYTKYWVTKLLFRLELVYIINLRFLNIIWHIIY